MNDYLIYMITFAAAFAIVALFSISKKEGQEPRQGKLKGIEKNYAVDLRRSNVFLKVFSFFSSFNSKIIPNAIRKDYQRKVLAAKLFVTAEEFFLIKELLGAFLVFLYFGLVKADNMLFPVICFMVGFMAPDLWMKARINKFKEEIARTLPDVIDLLSLAVGAGLDFMLAVKWVIDKSKKGALTQELALVVHETTIGRARSEALRNMARRLEIQDVNSFVRTLIQADKMGTSVSDALKILSEEARMRRFQRGERIALQAPIKMLVPLIFCILPVVGIVVGGPILIQFMQGGIGF